MEILRCGWRAGAGDLIRNSGHGIRLLLLVVENSESRSQFSGPIAAAAGFMFRDVKTSPDDAGFFWSELNLRSAVQNHSQVY
jgi:hypothetical protein